MTDLSKRATSPADAARVHRCVCGAWAYQGKPCPVCKALKGRER